MFAHEINTQTGVGMNMFQGPRYEENHMIHSAEKGYHHNHNHDRPHPPWRRRFSTQETSQTTRAQAIVISPRHRQGHQDVLVERVQHDLRHAPVVLSPVEEHELAQESKLRDSEIARIHGLETQQTIPGKIARHTKT